MSLTNKTFGALRWSALQTIGEQGIRFAVTIVIARLLLPQDYGLTAMLAIFIGLGQLLISSGFARAIVQARALTQHELSSVFYFNLAVAVVCGAMLACAGPWIAGFYRVPLLASLCYVMAFGFIISALGLVQQALLTKALDFRPQFFARTSGAVIGGGIGIAMAWKGFGVWSLVGQSLLGDALAVAIYWRLGKWRPSLHFCFADLRHLFGFGSKLLFSGTLDVIFQNIYTVVIGKAFSAGDLGLFTRAQQLQQLPVTNLGSLADQVLFSSFSTIQDDKERLKRAMRRAVTTLSLVSFPMMAGLAVVARPLVLVLLTAKWEACIPYLQLLCVAGAIYPLQVINLSVLTAQGHSNLFLRVEIIKKCFLVLAVAFTWRWGISAMILGQIVLAWLCLYINTFYTQRFLRYGFWSQIRDMLPYAAATGGMSLLVYLLQMPHWNSNLLLLLTQCGVGALVYLAFCRLFALEAFMELWSRFPIVVGFYNKYLKAERL
jgi:teichuronic acid exporter